MEVVCKVIKLNSLGGVDWFSHGWVVCCFFFFFFKGLMLTGALKDG